MLGHHVPQAAQSDITKLVFKSAPRSVALDHGLFHCMKRAIASTLS